MTRSEAVALVNQGIGFRPSGNSLEGAIVLKLQEAQRDLESGKSLPKFLIQENQTLTLPAGSHSVTMPSGFLRESDENPLHYFSTTSGRAVFLVRRGYKEALESIQDPTSGSSLPDVARAPKIFVVRKGTVDFITTADQTYTFYWDYYKAADLLTTDIENIWLRVAPEWLWGEAGWRIAMDLGNADAMTKFDRIRTSGRAALFGEQLAAELASGELQMGSNL